MHKNPNIQTDFELINRGLSLKEGRDSLRYRETNMGFSPHDSQETKHRPTASPMVGYITNVLIHGTEVSDLFDFRFKHSLDKEFPEIPLFTRNKDIYDDYYRQLRATPGWQQLGANAPPIVNVIIDSQGIGFEILQITILECQFHESIEVEGDQRKNCSEAYQRGIDNYKLEQHEKSIADFDEAIQLDPDNTTGYHPYIYALC